MKIGNILSEGRWRLYTLFLLVAMVVTSCMNQKTTDMTSAGEDTKTYVFKDSCQHLTVSLSIELPVGSDSISLQIRDSLIADLIHSVNNSYSNSPEDNNRIKPFDGNSDDIQAVVGYYGKEAYARLLIMAKSDYEQRLAYLEDDTTITEEDRDRIMNDVPMWAFELCTAKTVDTPQFVVYYSQTYCYYGGAHGGVSGSGAMTFRKDSGSKIEGFIMDDATDKMQPLIRKGLTQYYCEYGDTISEDQLQERLQIDGKIIPQPYRTPCPNAAGDSLTFTYGQYEIACYADGMPSFTLSVKELLPYLTKEGKNILKY